MTSRIPGKAIILNVIHKMQSVIMLNTIVKGTSDIFSLPLADDLLKKAYL